MTKAKNHLCIAEVGRLADKKKILKNRYMLMSEGMNVASYPRTSAFQATSEAPANMSTNKVVG